MRYFYLFTIILFPISKAEPDIFLEDERNLRCCAQKAPCCKMYPTDFEVKAFLVKCHKAGKTCKNKKMPMTVVRKVRNVNEEKIHTQPSPCITQCKRKLKLTLRIKNEGITNCKNQYVLIDHVFDAVTNQKQKLFNPYVIKIMQQPVMAVYGLCNDGIVNAEAKEMVYNKEDQGYPGCDANSPNNPVCSSVTYKNEKIPYSNGFCCSCSKNRDVNFVNMSQLSLANTIIKEQRSNTQQGPFYKFHQRNNNQHSSNFDSRYENDLDYAKNMHMYEQGNLTSYNPIRELHKRGGQDCNDKFTPANIVNSEAYHSSSHCLHFSDIWYFVYRLQKPKLQHAVTLQIFEKYQTIEGGSKWRELNKKVPIFVGTDEACFINDESTLSVEYKKKEECNENLFGLNYMVHKLLVPDVVKIEDKQNHPEVNGGPPEYLVVKSSQVIPNGKTCNVAGVGYEAFVKQPNRCSMPKGTCLRNQPMHMWRHDHEQDILGRRGDYFLKYYGVLPDNPIYSNTENKSLLLYFTNTYISLINIEVKADNNPLLRPNSLATITEVYIDSTNFHKTSIVAKIFNSGLTSSIFYVGLTDCPLSLPASFSHIYSKSALIPPQQQHVFNLEIQCPLPLRSFICSLQVLNMKQELIAIRKIRLENSDRCVCIWYCSCSCYVADFGLKCTPLILEAYHIAGFQGGLSVPLQVVEYTLWDDIIAIFLYIFITLCLTLLAMGLLKGLFGLCFVPIGLWGLDVVLDYPKKLEKYYEKKIKNRSVIYDAKGWPVHPDTVNKVRNIPIHAEFCINLVFFIVYPFCVTWHICKKIFGDNSKITQEDIDLCYCKKGTAVQKRNCSLQNSLNRGSKQFSDSQMRF